ncbi:MAG: nuclear transport factor 2 family protein [Terriglobales bacterium]
MKKMLIGCVVMGIFATLGVVWAHRTAESAPREDFVSLEHRWLQAEAKGDTQTLQAMYGDEFLGVSFGPELLNKTDVMPFAGKPSAQWASATLENVQARVYGNVAIVFDLIRPAGAKSAEFCMTKIYNHRYGHWQVVAAHLSKVTGGPEGLTD